MSASLQHSSSLQRSAPRQRSAAALRAAAIAETAAPMSLLSDVAAAAPSPPEPSEGPARPWRPAPKVRPSAARSAPSPDPETPGIAEARRRGRGAGINPTGRFEPEVRELVDDGWGSIEDLPAFRTEVREERARTLITRNESPDVGFDRSINPYRGCEHGCIYCFARPNHSYVGLSPGLDFESKLFAKVNAVEVLERDLAAPSYRVQTVALGTATDPYQPVERERRLTRGVLEVLARTRHPVGIVTKSALVTRDIDILAPMAAQGLVKVAISLTTLDRRLARSMEPRASTPERRLAAIKALSAAGIPTTVMVAPVIPALNDSEIEAIREAARAAGAREAGYVLLRLPLEVADLFKEWLARDYPDRFRHVMSMVRAMRDGKDYDAAFNTRMKGTGPYAWTLGRRFELAAKRLGLNERKLKLRCDLFEPPLGAAQQLSLF